MNRRYAPAVHTLSDVKVAADGSRSWDVFSGSELIGAIETVAGGYAATVGGHRIQDVYERLTVAAAAVGFSHDRIKNLGP